jgi:hypothetical protein
MILERCGNCEVNSVGHRQRQKLEPLITTKISKPKPHNADMAISQKLKVKPDSGVAHDDKFTRERSKRRGIK